MKEQLIEELIEDEEQEIDFVELSSELEKWIVDKDNPKTQMEFSI